MGEHLSISAYARHRGVSHVAVLKAIKAGRIEKNSDGTVDVAKADAAWALNTSPSQQRGANTKQKPSKKSSAKTSLQETERPLDPPLINSGPSYAQSRAVKEAYLARLAKLDYEEKSAALVRSDNVKIAWFNILRVLRDRILNLPDRLAPILAAETDPKAARELLDTELRQVLNDAADAVSTSN